MADIFISYSQRDTARANAIATLLRNEGYDVAIDHDFLTPGEPFREHIGEELGAAKVVIVLWSAQAIQSSFVRDEASRAARRAVLLQLIIDEMPDGDVPLGFGELQWLRCAWEEDGDVARETRDELLAALRRHLPAIEPLAAAIVALQGEVNRKLGDEYEVLERIGTGRMSVVFKARHTVQDIVALKVTPLAGILLLPGFFAEFMGSLEAARQLAHANILRIRDVRLLDTIACTIVDYVEGASLARCIAKAAARDPGKSPTGGMPLGRVKDIASDIAEGLAHAHQAGVVHSSLSPSNILIDAARDRPLISDFGMLNVTGSPEATAAKALFFDARYMSPEQCHGDLTTPQSDQYAFGAILYEMLTGRPPFVGKTSYTIMNRHCDEAPRPVAELRPDVPRKMATTIMRMLSKKPKDRYLTTGMLRHEIAAWPLSESVRWDGSSPRSGSHPVKAALESYNRCLAQPDFLAAFYQRLLEDATLAPHLENMNFDRQVDALKKSIRHLLEYAQQQEDARQELDRVAIGHRRFGLQQIHVQKFVDTLIELVLERDPQATDAAVREALRSDWHQATESGLARFVEMAKASTPRVSAVVPAAASEAAPAKQGATILR